MHCFGFDNGFYYAVFLPAMWMAYDRALRLPAAFIMNEFYRLDGLKFSTSRRPCHLGARAAGRRAGGRDALLPGLDLLRRPRGPTSPSTTSRRPATASSAPGRTWLAGLGQKIRRDCAGVAPSTGDWTVEQRRFFGRLEELTAEAARAYEAAHLLAAAAARVLSALVREAHRFGKAEEKWHRVPARGEERRTAPTLELLAAKTLAVLAAPLTPEFAARLWRDLGFETAPPLGGAPEPGCRPGQKVGDLGDALLPAACRANRYRRRKAAGGSEPAHGIYFERTSWRWRRTSWKLMTQTESLLCADRADLLGFPARPRLLRL